MSPVVCVCAVHCRSTWIIDPRPGLAGGRMGDGRMDGRVCWRVGGRPGRPQSWAPVTVREASPRRAEVQTGAAQLGPPSDSTVSARGPSPYPSPPPVLGLSRDSRWQRGRERRLRKVFGGSHEVSALDSGSSPAPALPRCGARGRRFTSLHLAPHGSVKGRGVPCARREASAERPAPRGPVSPSAALPLSLVSRALRLLMEVRCAGVPCLLPLPQSPRARKREKNRLGKAQASREACRAAGGFLGSSSGSVGGSPVGVGTSVILHRWARACGVCSGGGGHRGQDGGASQPLARRERR